MENALKNEHLCYLNHQSTSNAWRLCWIYVCVQEKVPPNSLAETQ